MSSYLIAAGGTGGHIYPGIAIADKIKAEEKDSIIVFAGTANGMENKLVTAAGYEIVHIDAKGFSGKSPIRLAKALSAYFKGKRQCRRILTERKIDLVIGTGGYVCGPVLAAAQACKVRNIIHEQNSFPGKANRMFASRADIVCISYPSSAAYFKKTAKLKVTGNPVRDVFKGLTKEHARSALKIDPEERLLFATGGSLGSRTINNAVAGMAANYYTLGFRIILSSGSNDFKDLSVKKKLPDGIFEIHEYIPDQHVYMAAADLVLCRAGAMTCSELAVLGKACVMVPYPYAAGDHQTMNAAVFADSGAAVMISDQDLSPEVLYEKVRYLIFDKKKLNSMEKAASELAYPDAEDMIYEAILSITGKAKGSECGQIK